MAHCSTAISDFFLALSAFGLSYFVHTISYLSAVGFILQGLAATLGVAVFGMSYPSVKLTRLHFHASWIATTVGMSLISAGIFKYLGYYTMVKVLLMSNVVLWSLRWILSDTWLVFLTRALSAFAIISLVVISTNHSYHILCVGSLFYILAGGVVNKKGAWLGIPRVDLFHYFLVIGNILMCVEFYYILLHRQKAHPASWWWWNRLILILRSIGIKN